jgi:hypothetical protein
MGLTSNEDLQLYNLLIIHGLLRRTQQCWGGMLEQWRISPSDKIRERRSVWGIGGGGGSEEIFSWRPFGMRPVGREIGAMAPDRRSSPSLACAFLSIS